MAALPSRASGTSSRVRESSSAVRVRQSKPSTKAVASRGSCQSGHYLQCDWKCCAGNSRLLHALASGQLSPRLCFTDGTKIFSAAMVSSGHGRGSLSSQHVSMKRARH